jgi:hypothetical protein
MAEWKKVIVSGSNAELNKLVVDTQVSASLFSGSFVGDGSGLTGLPAAAIASYTNAANNRVITSVNGTTVNGEENLTFDGNTLGVTGTIFVNAIGGISGSSDAIHLGNYNGEDIDSRINGFGTENYILQSDGAIEINHPIIKLTGIPTGTDNSVVIWNGTTLATDEIDPRVWGTTLVDAANGVNNRLATFSDADSLNGEANLTFDGSVLGITGRVNASSTITGSRLQLTAVPAGTDNTVLVLNSAGGVVSDEIDSRVWGSTLIDGSLSSGRVPYASDANTIQDSTNLTFNGTTLTANTVSVTNNLTVGGNLFVNGELTNINTANLNIEDQFILLNSGSTEPSDTGIIFGGTGGSANQGASLFWDSGESRLSIADDVLWSETSAAPSGYITIAYDVTGASHTPENKVGNIKIESGEAYIFV